MKHSNNGVSLLLSKLLFVPAAIIICIIAAGCNSIIISNKPSLFYYTNILSKELKQENSYLCIAMDTNFYKEHTLALEDKKTIGNFINNLHKENFINKPKDLPKKPFYKLYFTFKNSKYLMDIYNENYAALYPWDGNYEKDYINMSNIPAAYNLYSLCKYMIPRQ